jgi:hypothetical protein
MSALNIKFRSNGPHSIAQTGFRRDSRTRLLDEAAFESCITDCAEEKACWGRWLPDMAHPEKNGPSQPA